MCQVDTKSLAGAQYFVTFIDDHRRRLWTTPLKTKDQVLSVLKELHGRVERESGRNLKAVRADNGGEYQGQFEEHCLLKGIRLEFTVPKTPELNGLAERMNQTIMERVRSMLAHAKLPKTFWAEALLCTHNVGEGRSLIFTLVKGMFTIIKKGTNDWIE